jgi:hypothetical protein
MRLVHGACTNSPLKNGCGRAYGCKKSLIRDSCGGAYITEPCIQETTLAGMKNCDPARVPTCPL